MTGPDFPEALASPPTRSRGNRAGGWGAETPRTDRSAPIHSRRHPTAGAPRALAARYVSGVLLRILVLLLGVQLIDLLLLVMLSRSFGFLQTLVALFAVGLVGSALARREGGKVWRGFQASMAEGRPPEHGIIDGMLVLLGGVLLLLPGILSDVLGLALFVPPLRRALARTLRGRISRELELRPLTVPLAGRRFSGAPAERSAPPGSQRVIDTTGVESPE